MPSQHPEGLRKAEPRQEGRRPAQVPRRQLWREWALLCQERGGRWCHLQLLEDPTQTEGVRRLFWVPESTQNAGRRDKGAFQTHRRIRIIQLQASWPCALYSRPVQEDANQPSLQDAVTSRRFVQEGKLGQISEKELTDLRVHTSKCLSRPRARGGEGHVALTRGQGRSVNVPPDFEAPRGVTPTPVSVLPPQRR